MQIDLRSDTVTRPTPSMLVAMMNAEVGDDVFEEDPSVKNLEAKAAALLGMEDALFCPSGTMSNQIAIACHAQGPEEVICESQAHVYVYEGGGIAYNARCQARPLVGDRGRIRADQVAEAINPDDVHRPRTALVCLENTSNRGGGSTYDLEEIRRIHALCQDRQIKLHLDGARLFNAIVANQEQPDSYGPLFDSISICLNKGLGCPVGSVLVGSHPYIKKARRFRKLMGGGMRQAGYLAAAGSYALENHISRLKTDHLHASHLAEALAKAGWVHGTLPVETNIIIIELNPGQSAAHWVDRLREKHILVLPIGNHRIRMVTHLDITESMTEQVIETIRRL